MSANSILVNNISVDLLVFKWTAQILIVFLCSIHYYQLTNSSYKDIFRKLNYRPFKFGVLILDISIYVPIVIQYIRQKIKIKYFGNLPVIYIVGN